MVINFPGQNNESLEDNLNDFFKTFDRNNSLSQFKSELTGKTPEAVIANFQKESYKIFQELSLEKKAVFCQKIITIYNLLRRYATAHIKIWTDLKKTLPNSGEEVTNILNGKKSD